MMLLQAGQMGLYRRDSIWTNEIPPEMVAGCTMWIDATDISTLYKGERFDGGSPSHDDEVKSVVNKIAPADGFIPYGEAPKFKDPAVNSKSALVFQPVATTTAMLYATSVATIPVQPEISTLVTATTKLVIAAVKIGGARADSGNPWENDFIFADGGGYVGLHVTDDGGVLTVHAYNYVGGSTLASRVVPRDEWIVITMSHQSGQLRCRCNGGSWATVASGTTDIITGTPYMMLLQDLAASEMEVAHIAAFNTAQTDAAISAVERWAANDVGITPW